MSKNTASKKRKKLIAQGTNVNLDSAAAYFGVPAGFLRQYWQAGSCRFEELEKWMRSSESKLLLQKWDSTGRGPKPIEGCEVRYSQVDRDLGRPIRTQISDCTVSRKKGNLVVKSGKQEIKLPMAMKSLEVRVPYSSDFRRASEVFS